MAGKRDWERSEAVARTDLEPFLREYLTLAISTCDLIDASLDTASASRRQYPPSAQVLAVLLARMANDLRVTAIASSTGYVLQAQTLAGAIFETAHIAMYIGKDDARANQWTQHANTWRAYPGIRTRALIEECVRALVIMFPTEDAIRREVDRRLRVFMALGLGRHGYPLLLQHYHVQQNPAALTIRIGPRIDQNAPKVLRLHVVHAVDFVQHALSFFVGHFFTVAEAKTLCDEIAEQVVELTRLRRRDLRATKKA